MNPNEPKKARPLITFSRRTYNTYGYDKTEIVAYHSPSAAPIATMIANCDREGWYSDANAAARMKRVYLAQRDAGVSDVLSVSYATRVQFTFQHFKREGAAPAPDAPLEYCEARIDIGDHVHSMEQNYRFLRKLQAAMSRVDKYHCHENPAVLLTALTRLHAREMFRHVDDQSFPWSDWVFYAPSLPLQVAS